uniref:Uncharacterized protein n=1 Tax=Rhizophora mucronata TaxID=61149 RepID=A0A2P2PDT0_RHIMU
MKHSNLIFMGRKQDAISLPSMQVQCLLILCACAPTHLCRLLFQHTLQNIMDFHAH